MVLTIPCRGASRRRPARGDPAAERGMVTAEIAAALPVIVALVVAAVWTVAVGTAQSRCVDAAREAARAMARGESDSLARDVAEAVAPDGARVTIERSSGSVEVTVTTNAPLPPPLSSVGGPTIRGRAVAIEEPR